MAIVGNDMAMVVKTAVEATAVETAVEVTAAAAAVKTAVETMVGMVW